MRITNTMMVDQLLHNLNNNLQRMAADNEKISSGKKVNRPSDDPLLASRILKFRTDLRAMEQHGRNNSDAKAWIDATETTIGNIQKAMGRMKTLIVQAANDTNTPEDRKKMLAEVNQIKEDMISNGNFSFTGQYVFSSFHTDEKLLKPDGSFNIDVTDFETSQNPVSRYQIGVGEEINVMTSGVDIFGANIVRDELFATFSPSDKLYTGSKGVAPVKESVVYNVDVATLSTQDFAGKKVEYDGKSYIVQGTAPVNFASVDDLVSGVENAFYTDPLTGLTSSLSQVARVENVAGKLQITSIAYGSRAGDISISSPALTDAEVTQGVDAKGDTGSNAVTRGGTATRESVSYSVDEKIIKDDDFNNAAVEIDGQVYTITTSKPFKTKDELVAGIMNAENAGVKLSLAADVYFDSSDRLVIKSKTYGDTGDISLTGASSLASIGGEIHVQGTSTVEAVVSATSPITDFKASPFAGKSYVINVNGEVKKITLPKTPDINSTSDLQSSLQAAIDTAFPGKMIVSETGGVFKFETLGTTSGKEPYLEIKSVVATKPTLIANIEGFERALQSNDQASINEYLGTYSKDMEQILNVLADIGGRYNRIELVENRISENDETLSRLLTEAQYADVAEVYMKFKSSESVYNASLAAGAKAIQPSLVDFLR